MSNSLLFLSQRGSFFNPGERLSEKPTTGVELYVDSNDAGYTQSEIFLVRHYFDLVGSCAGLVFCSCHLSLLTYLVVKKNSKSYELLISQAILSVLTLLMLIIGCLLDLLDDVLPYPILFFRAYIWLFLVNSLMGGYGNLIVILCLDRYVAMHRPLYYRNNFAKRRIRYSLIAGSVILGFLTCTHWLVVNEINDEGDIVENYDATQTWQYIVIRTISYLFKYLVPGVTMATITWANIICLRRSVRSYDDELRIARQESIDHVVTYHTNIARISAFLAIAFIVCNWPYALIDYFYREDLEDVVWYGVLTLVINFLQIVYVQLNMLFFSLCSSVYRNALKTILMKPVNHLTRGYAFVKSLYRRNRSRKIRQIERYSSLSTESSTSSKTVFTVC